MLVNKYLAFNIDGDRFAIPLRNCDRVVHTCEITPIPDLPEIIPGVINLAGKVIPVIDMRKRLSLRDKAVALSDKLIIARTAKRTVALMVDNAADVLHIDSDRMIDSADFIPLPGDVRGVIKLDDGMVIIYDLDQFLSPDEEKAIDDAVRQEGD